MSCVPEIQISPLVITCERPPTTRSAARSIAVREMKRSSGFDDNALSITAASFLGTSGRTSESGGAFFTGGGSDVSVVKHSAASCH